MGISSGVHEWMKRDGSAGAWYSLAGGCLPGTPLPTVPYLRELMAVVLSLSPVQAALFRPEMKENLNLGWLWVSLVDSDGP